MSTKTPRTWAIGDRFTYTNKGEFPEAWNRPVNGTGVVTGIEDRQPGARTVLTVRWDAKFEKDIAGTFNQNRVWSDNCELIKKRVRKPRAFAVGDRIRYKKEPSGHMAWERSNAGKLGTISHFDSDGDVNLKWDGGGTWCANPQNIEHYSARSKAPREFKAGDRVIYNTKATVIRGTERTWQSARAGQIATVLDVVTEEGETGLVLRFDASPTERPKVYAFNVKHAKKQPAAKDAKPDALTIEKALDFLKSQGVVTFKKTFKPVVIELNGSYNAVVNDKEVLVGCQHIPFAAISKVYNAVRKAQKHNKENP